MWKTSLLIVVAIGITWAEYIAPGPAYRCPSNSLALHPCTCTGESDMGISVQCENSNLASISVGLKNLAYLNLPVESLDVDQCNIGRLYGNLLHTLKLRTLTIQRTGIINIEDHMFLGVNQTLQFLNITNSSLNAFPAAAFQLLGNASTIILDGNKIESLTAGSFGGVLSNSLERLRIVNGHLNSLAAEVFVPLRKLKILDLHGNNFTELKKGQFKGLRDLETLDLSFNHIKKLDAHHVSDLTKLGWCNMSHNEITDLVRGTFARNTVLKVVNLSHNHIKKLDANTFRGNRFLRRLFLSDNEISTVGRGTFSSVSRIGTIDLARNQITKIDFQMFFQLNFVEVIDLSGNKVTEIQKTAFKDIYLAVINVSHNAISKIESKAFENCANITFLDMSYNNISTFPSRAFDDTTYATHIHVPFNNLTSLAQIPLHNMTGLKILNASYNEITTVPKNTFPKLYELHTIDLSHNKINSIHNAVFQVLFSLRELNLSFNSLKKISSSMFGALPTLLSLDLRYNNLSDVSRSTFARFSSIRTLTLAHNSLTKIIQIPPSLSSLDLSHNKFREIPTSTETWPTMNALLSLDLSYNELGDSLSKGSFFGLLTLQRLNLNYNNISTAPWNSLSDLNSLQYLQMEGNNLTNLSANAFGRLPILFELNLAENKIQEVSRRAFDGLLQLLVLNLTNNELMEIPNGAFQGLVSLQTLDLSHNYLEKIGNKTKGLLDDCLSLERVNLSHNRISFITRTTFPNDPYIPYKLQEVDLSYNAMPVVTFELTIGTKKVQGLNLSHNSITEIRQGVIGNLTSLRWLDLSYNQISNMKGFFKSPPENLTKIYLGGNKLRNLPEEDFLKLKGRLQLLDLHKNELKNVPHNLVALFDNGTDGIFNGNPLDCDCKIRPVREWLKKKLHHPMHWDEQECLAPDLNPTTLVSQSDQDLSCSDTRLKANETFQLNPDVKFREISFKPQGTLTVSWLVSSVNDISDFYIFVQRDDSDDTSPIFEKLIAYSERRYAITAKEVKSAIKQKTEKIQPMTAFKLCIVSVDSVGTPGDLFESQCRKLPQAEVLSFVQSSSYKNLSQFAVVAIILSCTMIW